MTRYYGTNYCSTLQGQITQIQDSIEYPRYATDILNLGPNDQYGYLKDQAFENARSAQSHMLDVDAKLDALRTILVQFYDEVDVVSAEIREEALSILETLTAVNTAMTDLNSLLGGTGAYAGVEVNPASINRVCEPLYRLECSDINNLMQDLFNEDGTLNEDVAEELRERLAEMGITDISDDDLRLLAAVSEEMGKDHDVVYIVSHIPAILDSTAFDSMSVMGSNGVAFDLENMVDQLETEIEGVNIEVCNYTALLDSLADENGELNPEVLESFREQLINLGVAEATDDEIRAYYFVVMRMRELGYSDEEIMRMTDDIFAHDYLDNISPNSTPTNYLLDQIIEDSYSSDLVSSGPVRAASWAEEAANNNAYDENGNYIGFNYVWGGWGPGQNSPNLGDPGGYDCGHFVTTSMYMAGIFGPEDQAGFPGNVAGMEDYYTERGFVRIPYDPNNLQEGDVLIACDSANNPYHAGIYIGDGQFAHASTEHATLDNQVLVGETSQNNTWTFVLRYTGE